MSASVENGPVSAAASTRPPLSDPRLDFIAQARRFALERRAGLPFRFLKSYTRASEDEFAGLMAKVYCDALPQRPGEPESLGRSLLKLLLHPFHFALSRRFFWRRETLVDFDLETIDREHFDRWYGAIYDRLPGSKRMTPSAPADLAGLPASEPMTSAVTPRTLAWLFAAPLWALPLWLLSRREGLNLLVSYRRALSLYAVYEGHFRRYPCRHFVTYSDELNHPCRHLAFRQNCSGQLVAVQNGERVYHPAIAFGSLDLYLTFGTYMQRLCRDLQVKAGRIAAVGALNLDQWQPLLAELERKAEPERYDVLLIDQSLWPYNGLDRRTADSFEKVFANLDRLKKDRPELRVAFQLRAYGANAEHKRHILDAVGRSFREKIDILDNEGRGETYANIFRSRLVLCYNSTIGYEAFFCGKGKKTLFVNCSGDPCQILSPDPRFQLYDETADYGRFEEAVLSLLELKLSEPPEVARERHLPPDGRVPERIAVFLKELDHAETA